MATIIPVVLGFVLFPIFTHYLTPTEYGIRAIIFLSILIFNIISDFGTNWVIRYKFFRFDSFDSKKRYVTTLLVVSFLLKLIIVVLVYFIGKKVFPFIFNTWTPYYDHLLHIQLLIFFLSFINNIVTPILILEKRALRYMVLSLLNYFVTIIFSLLLLIKFKLGLASLFWGEFIGRLGFVILAFVFLKNYIGVKIQRSAIIDLVKIGMPAMPKNLFAQIQLNINKYFLNVFLGPFELGIFQKSEFIYKGFLNLQKSFGNVVSPQHLNILSSGGTDKTTGNYIIQFTYFLSFLLIASSLWVRDLFIVLNVNESFMACASYAPLYGFYILISHFSIMFVNNILSSGKTYYFTLRSIIVGTISIIANIYFIKAYGISGAIISLTITSFLALFIEIYVSERLLHFNTIVNYYMWSFIVLVCLMFIMYNYLTPIHNWAIQLGIFFIYISIILSFDWYFIKAVNWQRIRQKLRFA